MVMNYKKTMTNEEKRDYAINKRNELIANLAGQIIDLINGTEIGQYRKEWRNVHWGGLPYNPITGHRYSGFNLISLMMSGRTDSRFLTFEQILQLKKENPEISLRKGSKGVAVLKPVVVKGDKDKSGDRGSTAEDGGGGAEKQRVFFKQYTVFSGDQIEGMPLIEPLPQRVWSDDPLIENLVRLSGMNLIHGGNRAYYNPALDEVHLPEKHQFDTLEAYAAVKLHEWYHWTGHESRDNRNIIFDSKSESYAIEEIRAETFSALAGKALNLPHDMSNHAAYIKSWNDVLNSSPENVIRSAIQAGKMLEVVVDFSNKVQPEPDWFPKIMAEDFDCLHQDEDDYGPLFY
jgi:antirestriction protein ArdC